MLLVKNPQIYHRNNENPQNIKTLIDSLLTCKDPFRIHSIRPNRASDDLVPSGRFGDFLKRDEKFYENAQKALKDKVVANTLFFNYTGHQGPVAAALSEKGIGSSWNLTLNERIADQMQDWAPLISKNKVDPKLNSHGIILEPSHNLGMDGNGVFDVSKLPTPQALKRLGISRVVVFTEDDFNSSVNVDTFQKTNKEFSSYLRMLQNNHLELEFIGLDYNGSSTKRVD